MWSCSSFTMADALMVLIVVRLAGHCWRASLEAGVQAVEGGEVASLEDVDEHPGLSRGLLAPELVVEGYGRRGLQLPVRCRGDAWPSCNVVPLVFDSAAHRPIRGMLGRL